MLAWSCGSESHLAELRVNSEPQGATVFATSSSSLGDSLGITPLDISLTPGSYWFVLRKGAFSAEAGEHSLRAGETLDLGTVQLQEEARTTEAPPVPSQDSAAPQRSETMPDGWSSSPPNDPPRTRHSLVETGGRLYSIGGLLASDDSRQLNDVDEFSWPFEAWTSVTPLPEPLFDQGAAVASGAIYVAGGQGNTRLATGWKYDLTVEEWSYIPCMSVARCGLELVADGNALYAMGGYGDEDGDANDETLGIVEVHLPGADRWNRIEDMTVPRRDFAAADIDGRIYVAGGRNESGLVTPPEVYVPALRAWDSMPRMNYPRTGCAATVSFGKLYIMGGADAEGELIPHVEMYDPEENEWTVVTMMPTPRKGLALATRERYIYVSGGVTESGYATRLVEMYNVEFDGIFVNPGTEGGLSSQQGKWTDLTPPAPGRQHFAMAEVDGKLFTVGGTDLSGTGFAPPIIEAYDPVADSWETISNVPNYGRMAAVGLVGKLYIMGGADATGAVGYFASYDPAKREWKRLPDMPTPRSKLSAATGEGIVYAVGGWEGTRESGAFEAFDVATGTWEQLPPLPTPRERCAAYMMGGKLYVAGGATTGPESLVERYDPETNSWERLANMHNERAGCAAGVIDGVLYIVGGESWRASDRMPLIDRYDPTTDTWTELGIMSSAMPDPAAAVIEMSLFISRGGSSDDFPPILQRYEPLEGASAK